MSIEIKPGLERRLRALPEKRAQPFPELVEEALTSYLEAQDDEGLVLVRAMQKHLPRVWPVEDFSGWRPRGMQE